MITTTIATTTPLVSKRRAIALVFSAALTFALVFAMGAMPGLALAAEDGALTVSATTLKAAGDDWNIVPDSENPGYYIKLKQTEYSIDLDGTNTARIEYTLVCETDSLPNYVFYADDLTEDSKEIVKYKSMSDNALALNDGKYTCDGWIEYTGQKKGTATLKVYILVNGSHYNEQTVTLDVKGSKGSTNATEPNATTSTTTGKFDSKNRLTHEGFTVITPKKNGVYEVNKSMNIEVATEKFIAKYVNGFIDSKVNVVYFEILKDGAVKKKCEFEYSTVAGIGIHAVGSIIARSFTPTAVGTYTVRVGFVNTRIHDKGVTDANLVGSYAFKVIKKKANPMTVKAKTATFSAAKVQKKAQSVKASKAFVVKKAKGKVTYKVTAYTTKAAKGKVSVAKNGKVTVKRGTAKGTYKLKVKVSDAGSATYKAKNKTVTLKVVVK